MSAPTPDPSTLLRNTGLSVRAIKVCESVGCSTIAELSQAFSLNGIALVRGRRQCGKKTLEEICTFARTVQKQTSNAPAQLEGSDEHLLGCIERLQLPFGLPLELVRLPVRIQTWCVEQNWNTLGEFCRAAGGMNLTELVDLDGIGRKSAQAILDFFLALRGKKYTELRLFLPVSEGDLALSFSAAMEDFFWAVETRDLQMIQMRIGEALTLEYVARNFGCSRELIRQIERKFLSRLEVLLSWFSSERVKLWLAWQHSADLIPALSELGVSAGLPLISKALALLFESSQEGELLQEEWLKIFDSWSCELFAVDRQQPTEISLEDFAKEKGQASLGPRFKAWFKIHFGNALRSVDDNRAMLLPANLTTKQQALLHKPASDQDRWHIMYQRLKAYWAAHGNADVPNGYENDLQLASWVGNQRQRRKSGKMSTEEIGLLDAVGFSWSLRERGKWESSLAAVAAFRAVHGHCDIPLNYSENAKLGRFVNSMRTKRNRGLLSAERIASLDALGFVWKAPRRAKIALGEHEVSAPWKIRFEELMAYKAEYGDCDVPAKWANNEGLANWVSQQRQLKKRGNLQPGRENLLNEIGFCWQAVPGQQSWDSHFAELLLFKEQHGHCDVPVHDPQNRSLGTWVINQRTKMKRGKLSEEQVRLLSQAGFKWQIRFRRAHEPLPSVHESQC